ncbi:hypothetical protein [Actinacidiphila acididurans]|uniref:MarR family transcriptional regulator n=1 Tax=Actinacidiphila acididurans TaxID=2784346 RepID=A0ABS2U0W2_9ACTN|nr:hypothetical protein [Actinacidiphila acididurans]MBM9507833.1 hypothetical protein [Actinacidiphila acididurans]
MTTAETTPNPGPPAALPFGTALIGRTEKALNAILRRRIDGTGLTEPLWVALTLTATSQGPLEAAALEARVADAQQTGIETARAHLADLADLGFLRTTEDGRPELTEHGRSVWEGLRATLGETTAGLWGDLPAQDLAVAARVLTTVLTRAREVR